MYVDIIPIPLPLHRLTWTFGQPPSPLTVHVVCALDTVLLRLFFNP